MMGSRTLPTATTRKGEVWKSYSNKSFDVVFMKMLHFPIVYRYKHFSSIEACKPFFFSRHRSGWECVGCRWGEGKSIKREENTQKHTLSVNKCWSQRAQKINRIMDYWHIYLTGFKRPNGGVGCCKKFYFVTENRRFHHQQFFIEWWRIDFEHIWWFWKLPRIIQKN